MNKVTGLKKSKGREKRIEVFLDGKPALNLLAEVALLEKLEVGQEINAGRLESLAGLDRFQRCYNAAVRYLSYRPRSEGEIKQRLLRHGYDDTCAGKVITRLREQGLVDDTAFARFWIDNRGTFRPRSRRMTRLELRRKGLDADVIEQAVRDIDDRESAYRAALSRTRRLFPSDYPVYRRRLGQYLGRRGFSYDVINETVQKIWNEHAEKAGERTRIKR
jgi:regulatory protein